MNPGDHAVEFFPRFLEHQKGPLAGQPFELAEWQSEGIIRPLFGTLRDDGLRQYRRAYVEIPRKNGKTTLAAGIALYLLLADNEPGAEIYTAAGDRDQARLVHDLAKYMVENSPLRELCTVFRDTIVVDHTGSRLKVLSSEAYSKHGLNAHGIIFDEVHTQPNRELWDVLTTSTGARAQPLTFAITTAGVYDPESICWELHSYAEQVRDGIIEDPTFLPVLYSADKDDDWTDPEVWARVNPGLGDSVRLEYLEQEVARAKEVPAAQNTFRRLHLNQWTEQETRWLDMDVWNRCSAPPQVGPRMPAYAGLDLATTTDLTAFVLVFPGPDGMFEVLPRFYIPEAKMRERIRRDRVPYDAWARDGLVHVTPGDVTDYSFIRRDILELGEQYAIKEIAIDRWNATQLSVQLAEEDGLEVVGFGQGFASMSAPTKDLERLLLEGKLRHGGHDVLTWNAANVAVKQDAAGNTKPAKDKSSGRIDGIVALIMALGRAMANDFDQSSVYDRRGIRTL